MRQLRATPHISTWLPGRCQLCRLLPHSAPTRLAATRWLGSASSCTISLWLTRACQRSISHDTQHFHPMAIGRSTPAMVADIIDDVICNCFAVPNTRSSDLPWFRNFRCRSFCMCHCLTSAVYAARTDSPAAVL